MPRSKGSSTPERTSSPTELDILRALHAPDFPAWSDEPVAAVLAARLDSTARDVRGLLGRIRVIARISGTTFGLLDETWLLRADDPTSFPARVSGEGVVAWDLTDGGFAIVRTLAPDAVGRERRLRALHQRLGERPLAQLHRAHPSPPKRKLSRTDWALVRALAREPFGALDALAQAADITLRAARERLPKLAAERIVWLDARPADAPLARALVRVAPSSTAAAQRALDALARVVRAWVPETGEATRVDALVHAPNDAQPEMRAAALALPGVAQVQIADVVASWNDDAAFDALLKRALTDAA